MAFSLSAATKTQIQHAINLFASLPAYEAFPLDAQVVEDLARAAVLSGFYAKDGNFKNDIRDKPFTVLLNWLLFVGA